MKRLMNNIRRIRRALFFVLSVCLSMMLSACGGTSNNDGSANNDSSANNSSARASSEASSSVNSEGNSSSAGVSADTFLGAALYDQMCISCHNSQGEGGSGPALHSDDFESLPLLAQKITDDMPPANVSGASPLDCSGNCANNIAAFILNDFEVDDNDQPDTAFAIAGAASKRLTADMLKNSISIVMGHDIYWNIGRSNDGFEKLSSTLGKADYVTLTEDVREPSALYIKLMNDMALNVCGQVVDADYRETNKSSRSLVRLDDVNDRSESAILANLRYLKLRFHSEFIPPDSVAEIQDLKALFDSVANNSDAKNAWQAVCIAMLMSPEFHLY